MSAYKQHSRIRRVPLGTLRVRRTHRPYLSEEEFAQLLDGEVVVEEKLDGQPEVLELAGFTFYCENLRFKHTVHYTSIPRPTQNVPAFLVCYDVWISDEARFANREEKEYLCKAIGLPVAPLVFVGTLLRSDIPLVADCISAFGKEQSEGVVIKNSKSVLFGKFINSEFLNSIEDAEHWRRQEVTRNSLAT